MNHLKIKKFQSNIKNQKGDFLLEALISMFLLSIISLGNFMYFNATTKSLAELKQYSFVVNQMKDTLQTTSAQELCQPNSNLSSIYIPMLQKDSVVNSSNCLNKKVTLKHFEKADVGYQLIDLSNHEIQEYQTGFTISVQDYGISI